MCALLLALLSVVAGLADVTGYLTLGHVFTAHITGNVVLLAAQVVAGGVASLPQLLSIPVFAGALAVAYLLAWRVPGSCRSILLVGQALLLCLVFGLTVRAGGSAPCVMILATILAVSAMSFQNALVRLSLRASLSTSVMTSNVVTAVIALTALLCPGPWTREEARQKLKTTLPVVIGFLAGCLLGAVGVSHLGPAAWSIPALLSLVAIGVGRSRIRRGDAPGRVLRSAEQRAERFH